MQPPHREKNAGSPGPVDGEGLDRDKHLGS